MPKRGAESLESPARRAVPAEPGVGNLWFDFMRWMHLVGGFFFSALPMDIIDMIGDYTGEIATPAQSSAMAAFEACLRHPAQSVREQTLDDVLSSTITLENLVPTGVFTLMATNLRYSLLALSVPLTKCFGMQRQKKILIATGIGDALASRGAELARCRSIHSIVYWLRRSDPGFVAKIVASGLLESTVDRIGTCTMAASLSFLACFECADIPLKSESGALLDDLLYKRRYAVFDSKTTDHEDIRARRDWLILARHVYHNNQNGVMPKVANVGLDADHLESLCKSQSDAGLVGSLINCIAKFPPSEDSVCKPWAAKWACRNIDNPNVADALQSISAGSTTLPADFFNSQEFIGLMDLWQESPSEPLACILANFACDLPYEIGLFLHDQKRSHAIGVLLEKTPTASVAESATILYKSMAMALARMSRNINLGSWDDAIAILPPDRRDFKISLKEQWLDQVRRIEAPSE